MLTIQPNFTTRPVRQIAFKSEGVDAAAGNDPSNDEYQEKVKYYEKKVNEFDDALKDKDTPTILKKLIKVFKVASEALLEGWAVAWGAKKGADVIKPSMVKGVDGEFVKGVKSVLSPVGKLFGKIAAAASGAYGKFKATKFMTENSFGKTLTKGLEYVEKGFSYIGEKLSKLKGEKVETIYDKAANVTSKTMGAGAGIAGGYNAVTGADQKKPEKADNSVEDDDKESDIDEESVNSETNDEASVEDEFDDDEKFPQDGE